jgi:WD40 repeat protein
LNIAAIALSELDPFTVFTGSRDYTVKGWDIETGQSKVEFSAPRNIVTAMKCHPTDQNILFQCSEDLCVRVWDVRMPSSSSSGGTGGQPAACINGFVYFPLCIDVRKDGVLFCTGNKGFDSIGCDVKVWDLRRWAQSPVGCVEELRGHSQDVTGCVFMENSSTRTGSIVSSSKDGTVICWNNGVVEDEINSASVVNGRDRIGSIHNTGKIISSLALMENEEVQNQNDKIKQKISNSERIVVGNSDGSITFLNLGLVDSKRTRITPDFSTLEYFSKEN